MPSTTATPLKPTPDDLNNTLDKLLLNTLTLMEKHIQLKLELENAMSNGEMHLAKSRYIMGHSNISELQVPTKGEFEAAVKLEENEHSELGDEQRYTIVTRGDEVHDPIRWFGVLVPQNLYAAQKHFRQALGTVARVVSVQRDLDVVVELYGKAMGLKKRLLG